MNDMYSIPREHRVILWVLMVAWLGLIVFGAITGELNGGQTSKIPLLYRIACTFLLVVCAAVWWGGTIGPMRAVAMLICFGMSFGFWGDLVMGKLVAIPGLDHLILGMLVFGTCHVFYILAFRRLARILKANKPMPWVGGILLMLLAAVAVWYLFVQTPEADVVRNVGSLVYALLICAMAGCALGITFQRPGMGPAFIGAALLVTSDVLLAAYVFRHVKWFLVDDGVWLIFNVGQALIVFSTGYALRILRLGPVGKLRRT